MVWRHMLSMGRNAFKYIGEYTEGKFPIEFGSIENFIMDNGNITELTFDIKSDTGEIIHHILTRKEDGNSD